MCKPKSDGGTLEKAGVTEVTSSVYRDGRDVPHHLALGTYVVFEGESDYARRCFKEYSMLPDKQRPIRGTLPTDPHDRARARRLGRELRAAQRADRGADRLPLRRGRDREAALKAGEMLDGEGGFCVWGKQVPADVRSKQGCCRSGWRTRSSSSAISLRASALKWSDVAYDANDSP